MSSSRKLQKTCVAIALCQLQFLQCHAAEIVVNSGGDVSADDALCTLREAVTSANTNPASSPASGCAAGETGRDTIVFDTSILPTTIILENGELSVTDVLTLQGPGADRLVIYSNQRVLSIENSPASQISGLSINEGFHNDSGVGINIYNSNSVTISDCVISGNVLDREDNTERLGGVGVAVRSSDDVTIERCFLSENRALSELPIGGAILLDNSDRFVLSNSTVSNNAVSIAAQGIVPWTYGFGGALYLKNSSDARIVNSTIVRNTGHTGGAIYADASNNLTVENSIISGNNAAISNELHIQNSLSVASRNNVFGVNVGTIAQSFSSFSPGASDILATSNGNGVSQHIPKPLAGIITTPPSRNLGTTAVYALASNSPAINNGLQSLCEGQPVGNVDQIGNTRTIGGICDIGAFESPLGDILNFFTIPLRSGSAVTVPL